MRIHILYIILFFAVVENTAAQYSFHDTIPIKEIIVRESKLAGGKVETINPAILDSRLHCTLADVLSENSNLFIQAAAKGSVATVSMRGAGASHTKVLWEGLPINSPMTGQVDFSLLPIYFADEVSLYFGSAALVNTGGALGGSIAINNTPDWSDGIHGKIAQGFGSYGTFSTFGQINGSNSKLTSRTRLFLEQSKNNFTYFNNTVPEEFQKVESQQNAGYYRQGVLQELFYRVSDNAILGLNYWYQNSERNLPRLMNNTSADYDEKQFDTNHRVQTSFKKYGKRINWEINSGFSYSDLNYYLKNKPMGSTNFITNLDSRSKSYTTITQYKAVKSWENNWKLDLQATLGFYYAEFYDEKYHTGYSHDQNEQTLFIGLHKSFGDHWQLSGLMRQQLIDGVIIKPIPSVGGEYKVFDSNHLNVKANISRNFHNPTLNQLYFMPGGNPNLKPEQGVTSELSINSVIKRNRTTYKNELSAYYSVIRDWILWKPSQFGYWVPTNTQEVHSRGFEYTGKIISDFGDLKTDISFRYAFTPTTNESENLPVADESKGHQLIYLPLHSGGYTEKVEYKGYDFMWSSYYTGVRNTSTVSDDNSIPLEGYWLSNMSVGKKFTFKSNTLGMRFTIENVFNKNYQSIEYRPMPGRNYYVLVHFEF